MANFLKLNPTTGLPTGTAMALTDLPSIANNTILGNNSGSAGTPLALTVAQVNAILPVFTSSLNGLAPASGGGTTNFLRADGTWAAAGGGSGTVTSVGMTVPAFLSVTPSTITTSGTSFQIQNASSSHIVASALASDNWVFGSGTTDGNYRVDIQNSGSTGTLRIFDQTAITGATRVLVSLGAADSATTVTVTNAGVTQSVGSLSNLYRVNGTTFTVSGCATTSALTGGATSGSFATTTTGTCTAVVTMGSSATATNGWACSVNDQTTGNLFRQSATTTTTATLTGVSVSGDTISFHCIGY